MNKEQLKQTLEDHRLWLEGQGGKRADLRGADLHGANLSEADLRWADLRWADLRGANLSEANLRGANLYGANLYGADLRGAILRRADLRRANLSEAAISGTVGNEHEVRTAQLPKYTVVVAGDQIAIGCEQHSIDEWASFSNEEIEAMDNGALLWWSKFKHLVLEFASGADV